ncbi:hypothetical protein Ppb6_00573 [Photorhabdus australis subsp. thailandensis]|uniref:Uncharacterized protein n=1 Tax=Photorhabdus australis subsp. thailandensis TaxID=2805096 RepID=A0A1C0U8L1_9GAMM|nr:hypothetical protein [Photorhabdus australis]OCQ54261.1 hypothetical protein Ppb6_00573 [Photorhabdus australis subsp. thailandensis]
MDYLSYKKQADHVIAENIENVSRKSAPIVYSTMEDIYLGLVRLRNSQAFLYKDIYGKQISNEDERMIDAAIKAIFKKGDVIYDIVSTIINTMYDLIPERTQRIISEKFNLIVATYGVQTATKISIATAVTSLISIKINAVPSVKAKIESPVTYLALRSKGLEMLYFLVEPYMGKLINIYRKNIITLEDEKLLLDEIERLLYL